MDKYRDIGIKLTPQRLAILDFLQGNICHPSAEDIFAEVKKRFPTMSFATVYNTLEALKNKQRLLEINIDSQRKRFDPNPVPHHHVICLKCKKIDDVHKEFQLELPKTITDKFKITGNHIDFYGLCESCKEL